MRQLWDLIYHNDLKGKANFYMEMVVENVKKDTDVMLAENRTLYDRIKQDFENTPDGSFFFAHFA